MSKKEKKALKKLAVAAHIVAVVLALTNGAFTAYEHFHRTKAEATQQEFNKAVAGTVLQMLDASQQPEQKQSLHKNQAAL